MIEKRGERVGWGGGLNEGREAQRMCVREGACVFEREDERASERERGQQRHGRPRGLTGHEA